MSDRASAPVLDLVRHVIAALGGLLIDGDDG